MIMLRISYDCYISVFLIINLDDDAEKTFNESRRIIKMFIIFIIIQT